MFLFVFYPNKLRAVLASLWAFFSLCACSAGGGGLQNAAAPALDTGVAAPAFDPDGNSDMKGLYVKADIQELMNDEGSLGGDHVFLVKGVAFCPPADGSHTPVPCREGLTVKLLDALHLHYVDTSVKKDGAFETKINNLNSILLDDEACKYALKFFVSASPNYHSASPDQIQTAAKFEDCFSDSFIPEYSQVLCLNKFYGTKLPPKPPQSIDPHFQSPPIGNLPPAPTIPSGGSSSDDGDGVGLKAQIPKNINF